MHIEPIEERPGESCEVGAARLRRAPAPARRMAQVAARAAVRRADQERTRREPRAAARSRDAHATVFERLPQRFEDVATELGELVQKQHAVVRQTELAGSRDLAASDEPCFAYRVM